MEEIQKTVFSGLQPTGLLTIGNYIGALRNAVAMQDEYKCFYSVVDMHSITVDIQPAVLRKNTLETFALFIAAGLDPQKSTIFVQSHVPEHFELTWILNSLTMMGEAKRMIQFKEKSKSNPKNVNVGLLDYPVLMASDILLYQAHLVPIGKDQKQHLELARTLAARFNNKYSSTFVVPDPIIPKDGAKIQSLLNPLIKMSKTDENPDSTVFLLDDKDTVIRKFKRAVTDSDNRIMFGADKPGISNLLTIYSVFANKSIKQAEKEFEGKGYGEFKLAVGQAVCDGLHPIQSEYNKLIDDKAYLNSLMSIGQEKARSVAFKTLSKVKRKMGFLPIERK